ncbi:MAG: cardiolipin synthase [Lachnospiraceae bacterium]|nr:cardiolipin synthase [Lachnospiraceae bacterium]
MDEKVILSKDSEYAKKRKKFSLLQILFSPMFFIIVFCLLQIFIILFFLDSFYGTKLQIFVDVLNIAEIIYLINSKKIKDSFKITWMVVFIMMPIFGVILYIVLSFTQLFNGYRSKLKSLVIQSKQSYDFSFSNELKGKIVDGSYKENVKDVLIKDELNNELSFFNYFYNHAKLPTYVNTKLHYFNNGKDAFEDILSKLKNAKRFIFIEIFILSDGIIWQEMLKILKEKAQNGVEVKLMVDGLNSVSFFRKRYIKLLKGYNIEVKVFKPISPMLSNTQNHRDHRKIFVIDNEIAYTGGINIADEYANLYERFGYWKDSAIRIEGSAVESFTIMFLQLWQVISKSRIFDGSKYLTKFETKLTNVDENALYVPYTDYPNLSENISLQIYRYMFNTARKYMYIMTPYLVIDEALVDTIESCAKRGVDVRIIVPRIPDKKYVFYVNRSYYRSLVLAGAKVYEFVPGFIHSKVYLQDGVRAVVGTANLDYRSLYLHYENGLYLFEDNEALNDIKSDFEKVLNESKEMTISEILKMPVRYRLLGAILRIFAPLM